MYSGDCNLVLPITMVIYAYGVTLCTGQSTYLIVSQELCQGLLPRLQKDSQIAPVYDFKTQTSCAFHQIPAGHSFLKALCVHIASAFGALLLNAFKHLVLSVCHSPNCCLLTSLTGPKDRKCKFID